MDGGYCDGTWAFLALLLPLAGPGFQGRLFGLVALAQAVPDLAPLVQTVFALPYGFVNQIVPVVDSIAAQIGACQTRFPTF